MVKLSVLLLAMSSCHLNKILMLISIPNLLKKQVKLNSISLNTKMYLKHTRMERTFYSADWQVLKFQKRKQPLKNTSMEKDLNQDSKNTRLNSNKKKMKNLSMRKKNKKKEKTSNKKKICKNKNKCKNKRNNKKPHQQKRTQNLTKITTKNHNNNIKMVKVTKMVKVMVTKNKRKLKRTKNEHSLLIDKYHFTFFHFFFFLIIQNFFG